MTDLTRSERRLLTTLNVLRTLFIVLIAIGFILALFATAIYDNITISFTTTIIRMCICIAIAGVGIYAYRRITDIHDDMCYNLGLFDDISCVKLDKLYYQEKYDKEIKQLYHQRYSNRRKTQKTKSSKMNHYFKSENFDLRKLYPNTSIIPESTGPTLQFTPINPKKTNTSSD